MAFYPCDFDGHWNPKKNYLFYWAVGSGGSIRRWRARYCAIHCAVIQEDLLEYKVDPGDSAVSHLDLLSNCFSCSEPIYELGVQLFLTCYPPNNEREDYWARVHPNCSLPAHWGSDKTDPPIIPPQNVSISPEIANPPRSRDRSPKGSQPR